MKHSKILIFADPANYSGTDREEAIESARALFQKYAHRPYAIENQVEVELIIIKTTNIDFMAATSDRELTTEIGLVTKSGADDRVGVYYVAHGPDPEFPKLLHDFMRMKGWAADNLDYVNLTVCAVAAGATSVNWTVEPGRDYGGEVRIAPILQAFMAEGMRPAVASYAGLVTVAYEGMRKEFVPAEGVAAEHTGKKVIQHRSKTQFMRSGDTNLNIGVEGQRRYKYIWTYDESRGYYEPTKFDAEVVVTRPLPLPLREEAGPAPAEPPPVNSARSPLRVAPGARWMPDATRPRCARCDAAFTWRRRKHHCRLCGEVVCDACSRNRAWIDMPLNEHGHARGPALARVCRACWPA